MTVSLCGTPPSAGSKSTNRLQLNCRDSVATIFASEKASANCTMRRRFFSAKPRP
jgi:hypothetical protein